MTTNELQTALTNELDMLLRRYHMELGSMSSKVTDAQTRMGKADPRQRTHSHDAANMASQVATLADLAGKIEQTGRILASLTQDMNS
jgi:hypothetical protein